MSSVESMECSPPDGLYEKTSKECQKCQRQFKEVCKFFAVTYGLQEKKDMIRKHAKVFEE